MGEIRIGMGGVGRVGGCGNVVGRGRLRVVGRGGWVWSIST